MTHYTVQFNSAIAELATVCRLEQARFQGTLENWRGSHQHSAKIARLYQWIKSVVCKLGMIEKLFVQLSAFSNLRPWNDARVPSMPRQCNERWAICVQDGPKK